MQECERYLGAIGELVDGTLGPIRRAELEVHLDSCDACRALAADLTAIARAARTLDQPQPPERVWQNIAARLGADGRVAAPARRLSGSRNIALLAMAAALLIAVGASLFVLWPRQGAVGAPPVTNARSTPASDPATPPASPAPAGAPLGNAADGPAVQDVVTHLDATEKSFQSLVEATQASSRVDPKTAATMKQQLLVMNEALHETRKVLDANPQDAAVQQSLYQVLKKKIQFLQDTIALMNEMRQGDAAGAAEIVESGKS